MPPIHPPIYGRCPLCYQPIATGALCEKPNCVSRRRAADTAPLVKTIETYKAQRAATAKNRTKKARKSAKARLNAGDSPVVVAIVPRVTLQLTELSAQRRAAFLDHLGKTISEAFETDPQKNAEAVTEFAEWKGHVSDSPLSLNASCIACEGSCCTHGATRHGFITTQSITFQRLLAPDLTAQEVYDIYVGYMPEQSMQDSCVYHGPQGCVMPRERRAKICNEWQCVGRLALAEAIEKTGAQHSIVIAIRDDHMEFPKAGADVMRIVSVSPDAGLVAHPDLKAGGISKENPLKP